MKNIIYYVIIIKFLIVFKTLGQEIQYDIKYHYHNGKIYYEQQDLLHERFYNEKTILLQFKFKSGKIAKEYIKLNDSIFLYTEYFDSISPTNYTSIDFGKKREGYLEISNELSGDTITYLDYDTYEQTKYLDTLLLPIGKWSSFYQNGLLKNTGEYEDYQRNGKWKFYDNRANPIQEIDYQFGEIHTTLYQNLVADKLSILDSNKIIGNWFLVRKNIDKRKITQSENESDMTLRKLEDISGVGHFYVFEPKGEFFLIEKYVVSTEYLDVEGLNILEKIDQRILADGNWRLIDNNKIEVISTREKNIYSIEYLSNKTMILLK